MKEENYIVEEKNKTNWWKIATIILAIITCILLVYPTDKIVKLGDNFEIKESYLKNFHNIFGNETIQVCNLAENKCIYVRVMS